MPEMKPGNSDLEGASLWTDFEAGRIIKWGDEVIALPCDAGEYTCLYRNLRIVKAGTKISVSKKNDNIPSPELALSVRIRAGAFPVQRDKP